MVNNLSTSREPRWAAPSVRYGTDSEEKSAYACDGGTGHEKRIAALSQQRVADVREALVRAGVSPDRIETGGFGAERAKCIDASEMCSQRDGRVEVMVRPAS